MEPRIFMERRIFNEEQQQFRRLVREFVRKEIAPRMDEWEAAGMVPHDVLKQTAALGINGIQIPEEYGGSGVDTFKFNMIFAEELGYAAAGLGGMQVHFNTVLPYYLHYCNEEQRRRWFPGLADGTYCSAIAMTEPGTGSDIAGIRTTAVRDGDHYIVNGAKTFITGGIVSDLYVTVCRTDPGNANRREGLSLLVLEKGMKGFEPGRRLEKLGLRASDTAELSFNDVRVPVANLLGEEGNAFRMLTHNLSQERMSIAINALASATAALTITMDYVKERKVFGQKVADFQNTKFSLADIATELQAAQALVDQAVEALDRKELTPADAAKVKLFCTETQGRVVDRCLQLHGGYGYMLEYPISRLYADARITRIFGGTSEVMKVVISKSLGL